MLHNASRGTSHTERAIENLASRHVVIQCKEELAHSAERRKAHCRERPSVGLERGVVF